jgi:Flp pilus assembly pilin Flp
MQRLMKDERGAVAVIVALVMVVLLGFAALAVDVSGMWAEKRQLQNAADAGALAVAQECAKSATPCTMAVAPAKRMTAQNYAGLNRTVGAPVASIVSLIPGEVKVQVEDPHENWFAQVIKGGDSSTVNARATAKWGGPSAGGSFPLAFSVCEWGWQAGGPDSTTKHLILTSKTSPSPNCTGPSGLQVPGGFGWLASAATSACGTSTTVKDWVGSEPGNNPSKGCTQAYFQSLLGKTILVPIFGEQTGTGNGAQYRIYGYAAFKFTGYFFGSSFKSSPQPCNGNDRCIEGYFTRYVNLDEVLEINGAAPDLGLTIITLTN